VEAEVFQGLDKVSCSSHTHAPTRALLTLYFYYQRPNDPDGEEGHDDKKKKKKKKKKNLFVRGWTATWNLFSVREDKGRRKMYSVVGSPEYMAVEILSQEGYTESVDCWSLGVLLYEFVFGFTPFGAETALRVFNNIRNWAELLKRPPSIDGEELPVSSECWDLITKYARAVVLPFLASYIAAYLYITALPKHSSPQKACPRSRRQNWQRRSRRTQATCLL
jgi:serine/threonine protein kinase